MEMHGKSVFTAGAESQDALHRRSLADSIFADF
jgi:hypothetical protein